MRRRLRINLVTRLVVEQSGGEVVGPLVDVVVPEIAAKTAERAAISLKVSEVRRHLGTTADGLGIGEEVVAQYLSALGCGLTQTAAGEYAVKLPSWRLDLEREIDLIEEVARVYGYNRFADTLPSFAGAVSGVAACGAGSDDSRDAAGAGIYGGGVEHVCVGGRG